jgi:hypothetical protein
VGGCSFCASVRLTSTIACLTLKALILHRD